MSYFKLEIEDRSQVGTGKAKALRRLGLIPVNFYYSGQDNINLSINKKALYHAIHSGQRVFELSLNGETIYAMIKELQYHPVTEDVIHVDLMRVRRSEKMTFTLPVILEGEAAGVNEGGILTQVSTTVDVECLPTDVPENIVVDVSGLEMNSAMTASEISLEGDITLITTEDTTIATVAPPKAEVEPEVEEEVEGEVAEEGETPKEGESDEEKDDSQENTDQ